MGDYIERMAALNVNFKIPTRFCESKLTTARKAVQEYANEIAKIPTADVRPVVRGKWIEHYEPYSTGEEWIEAQYGYECSICGRWEYEKEPFCNCGADMREES